MQLELLPGYIGDLSTARSPTLRGDHQHSTLMSACAMTDEFDSNRFDDIILALLWANSFEEFGGHRAWKPWIGMRSIACMNAA